MVGPNTLEMEEKDMDGSLDRVQLRTEKDQAELQQLLERRQLPNRTERVDGLLRQLERRLDMLTEQLRPVLRAEGPRPAVLSGEDADTELAGWLSRVGGDLERLVDAVQQLQDRVDL